MFPYTTDSVEKQIFKSGLRIQKKIPKEKCQP
jgi:hypothetical protein